MFHLKSELGLVLVSVSCSSQNLLQLDMCGVLRTGVCAVVCGQWTCGLLDCGCCWPVACRVLCYWPVVACG